MTTPQTALVDLAELDDVTTAYAGTTQVRMYSETGPPGRATVLAEQSSTPGLVINPASTPSYGFTGYWHVTHAATGLGIPTQFAAGETIYAARRVAAALGGTDVDWTLPYEALRPQLVEHVDQIREAVLLGRYPAPDPDHMPPGPGPAPYPRSDAQATADAVARYLVSESYGRCKLFWHLRTRTDRASEAVASANMAALCTEYGLASVLREFARVDQAAADQAARDIWSSWEDGQSVHEFIGEWAQEYGIPEPPDVVDEQPPAMAVACVVDEDQAAVDAADDARHRRDEHQAAAAVEVKERNQT